MTTKDYIKLGGTAIGAVAILFIGWKGYKFIQDKAAQSRQTREYKQDLNKRNVTLSDSETQGIADTIYASLNTGWYQDDDEQAVYNELEKLSTPDDWKKLIIVFGKRKRDTWTSSIDGGLKEWLIDALSTNEQKKVREILSRKGITF